MKALSFFGMPLIAIWGLVIFVFKIDLEPLQIKGQQIFDPLEIAIAENKKQVVNVYCATLQQRIIVAHQEIDLLELQLKQNPDSTDSTVSKISSLK